MSADAAPGESRPASHLSVAQLEKRYKTRTVVHDVSLHVASGEVVGLLGPNGAGKTTCFYMIVGLVAADGGRIELDGRNLSRLPIHTRARLGLSYLRRRHRSFASSPSPRTSAPSSSCRISIRTRSPTASTRCSTICRSRISPTPARCRFRAASAAGGDRARARDPAALHPAGRAVRGRRPDRGPRYPEASSASSSSAASAS